MLQFFVFLYQFNPSRVCLNVCCNPAFLTDKSNNGYIIIIIIIIMNFSSTSEQISNIANVTRLKTRLLQKTVNIVIYS